MRVHILNEIRYTDDGENKNRDDFKFFDSALGLKTAKEILHQKVDAKIDLFENCLNEVGLYKSYPFMDLRYKINFRLLNKNEIHLKKGTIFPIDKTEEILMRNCVRRNMKAFNLSKEIIYEKIK